MINPEDYFIKDTQQYQKIWAHVNEVFYTEKRLPDRVFRDNFSCFLVTDTIALNSGFWAQVQKSHLNTKEQNIFVISLEDTHPNKSYEWFGYFNALQLSISTPPETYDEIVTYDFKNESMGIIDCFQMSPTAVWVPESLEWAIWQSWDYELCIIGFNSEKGADKIPKDPNWYPINNNWMTMDTAITDLISWGTSSGAAPQEIVTALSQNYQYNCG